MSEVAFFGWWLPPGRAAAASGATTNGRLTATLDLTASDLDDPADTATQTVSYSLHGPRDVTGLEPRSIVHTYPSRGARNVELDKAVYAELAAPDLPWRYSLDVSSGAALRPWLALLVGTTDEIEVAGTTVRLSPSVLDAHSLSRSAMACHVEQDANGRAVSRLLSYRALEPNRDCVAVVVPTYRDDGSDGWATSATEDLEVAAFDHWTFHTRDGGDFATLARRLRPQRAGADLGTAAVMYSPLTDTEPMRVAGALVSTEAGVAEPVSSDVANDVTVLTAPLGDDTHPVLGLPDYSEPWPPSAPASTGWRVELRRDPGRRGVAGLGASAAIAEQELLVREASRLAGAYQELADRLRRLRLGLLVSCSLWKRRVPTDDTRRLAVLGPALRNVLTSDGPVTHAMEHADRGIEASLFSSAARRALRTRRGSLVGSNASVSDVGATLSTAAAPAPRRTRSRRGALHADEFARARRATPLDDALSARAPRTKSLSSTVTSLAGRLDRRGLDRDTVRLLDTRLKTVSTSVDADRPIALLPLLELLDGVEPRRSSDRLRALGDALAAAPDSDDLAALGTQLSTRPAQPVATAYDIDDAGHRVAAAFDPTVGDPAMLARVLSTVSDTAGLVATAPLQPVEQAPDLDLAAWQFLRDHEPEWLLPGADTLQPDSVVALTTNPGFIDSFLVGLNAQLVGELRFRNSPTVPGWTPVRTFWNRANSATGDGEDDIVDIASWPPGSAFGAPDHQTPSASSADLVVLFSSALFREYPGTIVSLVPAARDAAGALDWVARPSFQSVQFPTFQGKVGPDRYFVGFDLDPALGRERWVVLEETVNGRRFFNEAGAAMPAAGSGGADVARAMISAPRRILIRGDRLLGAAS